MSLKQRQVVLQEGKKDKKILYAEPRGSQCVCEFACTHDAVNPVQASVQLQLTRTNMCSFKLDIIQVQLECLDFFRTVISRCFLVLQTKE